MTTNTAAALEKNDAKRQSGPIWAIMERRAHYADVLPGHLDVKTFLGLAAGALYRDEQLMRAARANPGSLVNTLMRCAALGHQPGTDEYYLIPRKRKGHFEVTGQEGYRGIIERMYRSGAVASVVVREVCAQDHFEYIEGAHDKPIHRIDWFGTDGYGTRGDMIGVYAYAVMTTGAVSRVVILSRADVMAARDNSDASDSDYSPWSRLDGGKDRPEFTGRSMWWKTAARRLEPWVPTSAEYRREQLRAAAAQRVNPDRTPPPAGVDPSTGEILDAELVDAEQQWADDAARDEAAAEGA